MYRILFTLLLALFLKTSLYALELLTQEERRNNFVEAMIEERTDNFIRMLASALHDEKSIVLIGYNPAIWFKSDYTRWYKASKLRNGKGVELSELRRHLRGVDRSLSLDMIDIVKDQVIKGEIEGDFFTVFALPYDQIPHNRGRLWLYILRPLNESEYRGFKGIRHDEDIENGIEHLRKLDAYAEGCVFQLYDRPEFSAIALNLTTSEDGLEPFHPGTLILSNEESLEILELLDLMVEKNSSILKEKKIKHDISRKFVDYYLDGLSE